MKNKWFWGLFFILAGLLILANSLGILISINIISLLLTIFLVAIIITSLFHPNFGGIFIPLAIIGIIHSEFFGINQITPWPILITAGLLTIGMEIIFGHHIHKHHIFSANHQYHHDYHENFQEIVDEADEDEVEYGVQFGSGVKYINTNNLKKAYLSCKCGALKVYFDNAKIAKSGAEIYLDITLSGAELYIPKDWNLIDETNSSLAGVSEKNRRGAANGPKVVLKGNISLSGVEIIYI